jgi:hypothetical protein
MSTRPFSLNDESPIAKRIRRDQFRRVRQIVTTNSEHPVIALGLVRDYFKNNPDVRSIRFDSVDTPTQIIVETADHMGLGGTQYQFALYSLAKILAPTL